MTGSKYAQQSIYQPVSADLHHRKKDKKHFNLRSRNGVNGVKKCSEAPICGKTDVDPSYLEMRFMPNRMN